MHLRVIVAWLLVAPVAAWVTVRMLGLERGFLLVVLMAYTPAAAAAAVVVVLAAAALRQPAATLVAAVLAVVLVVAVAPRALGGPSEPAGEPGASLRVLTVNLRYGRGSVDDVVALVRRTDADVLSLQELPPTAARELDAAGLAELLPERVVQAGPGASGIGLYARAPLRAQRARSFFIAAAAALPNAPALEIVALHPQAPLRSANIADWRANLRALPRATPDGAIRILAGDFNATLDHAELRRLLDSGYEDAAAAVGAGLRATWPSGRRLPPPVTIDHVLADARCGVREVTVHTIPGSDHRAVFAEIVLPAA